MHCRIYLLYYSNCKRICCGHCVVPGICIQQIVSNLRLWSKIRGSFDHWSRIIFHCITPNVRRANLWNYCYYCRLHGREKMSLPPCTSTGWRSPPPVATTTLHCSAGGRGAVSAVPAVLSTKATPRESPPPSNVFGCYIRYTGEPAWAAYHISSPRRILRAVSTRMPRIRQYPEPQEQRKKPSTSDFKKLYSGKNRWVPSFFF